MEPIVSDRQQPVRPKMQYGKTSFIFIVAAAILFCVYVIYAPQLFSDYSRVTQNFTTYIWLIVLFGLLLFGSYILSVVFGIAAIVVKEKHWIGILSLIFCAIPICIALVFWLLPQKTLIALFR